jgi:subtilisin family serine protease
MADADWTLPDDDGVVKGEMIDPALWELAESGSPVEEVAIILRLKPGAAAPKQVRVVSTFGTIMTARCTRGDILEIRKAPDVLSVKAGRAVTLPRTREAAADGEIDDAITESDGEAAPLPPLDRAQIGDGRGVVVGVCDWGIDFTHANFRNADGTTRLLCIWDQRGNGDRRAPAPFNYGRVLTREAINHALNEADPCAALEYHPSGGDPTDSGSHGTHVTDILAGNRREPGSEVGLATASDIVFVHLSAPHLEELANLGDSVGLLEGLDFVRRQAGTRPCVMHLSAGKTGGPHRGDTLIERAVDFMLKTPGLVLVQSVGNYADSSMHVHARVGPAQEYVLDWITPRNDRTPNELEIWYSGEDRFEITLISPLGQRFTGPLQTRTQLRAGLEVWGNLYHRRREPNSGLNHVDVYLYTTAPSGRWQVALRGTDVVDGRLHAWIERDASGRYQSRFTKAQASSRYTTNTICNCYRAIAVGAYDPSRSDRPPTRFSSRGPTADGRQKPELAAPGYRIRAARSMPRHGWRGEAKLVVKSGTSMAAPFVSGTVALMFAAAGRPLTIHEIRRALIGSLDPHSGPAGRTSTQLGYGYLNTAAAVTAARQIGRQPAEAPPGSLRPGEDYEELPIENFDWAPVPEETESSRRQSAGAMRHCGCGGGGSTKQALLEAADDEVREPLEEADGVPVEWDDIQEALEAVGEIDE